MKAIVSLLRWPVFGAIFAAGAIGFSRWAAPQYLDDVAKGLGGQAGEGFAEGVARFNAYASQVASPLVGRWSQYQ